MKVMISVDSFNIYILTVLDAHYESNDICRFIQHLHTDRSGCSCVYTAGTNNVSEW